MGIQYFTFAENDPFVLSSGKTLSPVTVAYETWGALNHAKSNAVLILHAFSGTSHAASSDPSNPDDEGWWEEYIGPGKAFDTDRYFIICSNVIGGCNGSTGPTCTNPATGKPYALDFPVITVHDMVAVQEKLVRHLGISKLLSVAGGSMGGMQALEWSVAFPEMSQSVICLAATHYQSAQGIAFNQVGRQAIYQDPHWNKGDYYGAAAPAMGLSLARMIGFITYLSERKMHEKFGRKLQDKDALSFAFESEFQVESYLRHQGVKFVARFDANSYLYLTKAIDYFDLKLDYQAENLADVFERTKSDFLMISFTSDWLYPPEQMREMINALRACGKNVIYMDIETHHGHDAFLLPSKQMAEAVSHFLRREQIILDEKNGG